MVIDLKKFDNKTDELVRRLFLIESTNNRSYMIISMNIFNLISNDHRFESLEITNEIDSLVLVGKFMFMNCYLDIYSSDVIKLNYDLRSIRNYKINNILSKNKIDTSELKIEVII